MAESNKPTILICSTSLFTDRILLYSSFAEYITSRARVSVWASSYPTNKEYWEQQGFTLEPFPAVSNFSEMLNVLREANNTAWAKALHAKSLLQTQALFRKSMLSKKNKVWWEWLPFLWYWLGSLVAFFRLHKPFEKFILKKLAVSNRSAEALTRLKNNKPDLLVSTNPMWSWESAVCVEAGKLNIPVFSFIPSWDNITTKSRFNYYSKAYAVWSDVRIKELHAYYHYTQNAPVYAVGAPQYDVFFDKQYIIPADEFFNKYGLRKDLPVVLYALGSPLFIKSEFGTCFMVLEAMKEKGMLEQVQVLVRPHPNKDNWDEFEKMLHLHPNVKLQDTGMPGGTPTVKRTQTQQLIADWVSTIYYANMVIAVSSTILLDGALLDKPLINVEFDPTPGHKFDEFLRNINRSWPHLVTLLNTNACHMVQSIDTTIDAMKAALNRPFELAAQRKEAVKVLLANTNGSAGVTFARAILNEVGVPK